LELGAWPEKEYSAPLALNPSYATAHHWYAWHLDRDGRNSEALAESRKAESLDPLSPIISAELGGTALCVAHLCEESVQQSRNNTSMHPYFPLHITTRSGWRKAHCMMRQLPNFGEQSSFPEAYGIRIQTRYVYAVVDGPMRR